MKTFAVLISSYLSSILYVDPELIIQSFISPRELGFDWTVLAFLNFLTAPGALTAFRMTHKPLLLFKIDIETFVVALALGSDSAWILVSILTSLRNLNSGWPFCFAFFPL